MTITEIIVDRVEWVGLNLASIALVIVPNWHDWIPNIEHGTMVVLKAAVMVSVIVLNVVKALDVRKQKRQRALDAVNDENPKSST